MCEIWMPLGYDQLEELSLGVICFVPAKAKKA